MIVQCVLRIERKLHLSCSPLKAFEVTFPSRQYHENVHQVKSFEKKEQDEPEILVNL